MIQKEQYRSIVTGLMNQNKNLIDISITNVPFKNIVNQIMAEGRIS